MKNPLQLLLIAFLSAVLFLGSSLPQSAGCDAAEAKGKLHRVDFRVTGASCVVCLRRIGKKLRETKGVLKADISIFKPYWGIAVYDAGQVTFADMEQAVKDEKVQFEDVDDKAINSMPALLIPKTTALPKR